LRLKDAILLVKTLSIKTIQRVLKNLCVWSSFFSNPQVIAPHQLYLKENNERIAKKMTINGKICMWMAWKIVWAATRRLRVRKEGHSKRKKSLHTQHRSIRRVNRINDDKLLLKWKEFKTNKKCSNIVGLRLEKKGILKTIPGRMRWKRSNNWLFERKGFFFMHIRMKVINKQSLLLILRQCSLRVIILHREERRGEK
jgi:hypothetical protein